MLVAAGGVAFAATSICYEKDLYGERKMCKIRGGIRDLRSG